MPSHMWTRKLFSNSMAAAMTELERAILAHIKQCDGIDAPATSTIHKLGPWPESKHALGMLQILGFVAPITPRKPKAAKRFRITERGRQALGRVAA